MDFKTPIAMGRSNAEPPFLIPAGERLMVNRLGGISYPAFFNATLILCADSFTSLPKKPTISMQGRPSAISTSTVTR